MKSKVTSAMPCIGGANVIWSTCRLTASTTAGWPCPRLTVKMPPIASKKRWAHEVCQLEAAAAAATVASGSSSRVCAHLAGDVPVVEALGALDDERICLKGGVRHVVEERPAQQALPPLVKHKRSLLSLGD